MYWVGLLSQQSEPLTYDLSKPTTLRLSGRTCWVLHFLISPLPASVPSTRVSLYKLLHSPPASYLQVPLHIKMLLSRNICRHSARYLSFHRRASLNICPARKYCRNRDDNLIQYNTQSIIARTLLTMGDVPPGIDLSQIPLAPNPNGDPPNFDGGPTLEPTILATGIVFIAISLIFVIIRLGTSLKTTGKFRLDDCA